MNTLVWKRYNPCCGLLQQGFFNVLLFDNDNQSCYYEKEIGSAVPANMGNKQSAYYIYDDM